MKIAVSIITAISIILGSTNLRPGIDTFNLNQIQKEIVSAIDSVNQEKASDVIEKEQANNNYEEEEDIVHTVTFLAWDDSVDFKIEIKHGESLSYIPDSEWENGIFEKWTRVDTGETFRADTPIYEDVIYEPNYIYLEWFILNALGNGELDLKDCDPNEIREIADYVRSIQE